MTFLQVKTGPDTKPLITTIGAANRRELERNVAESFAGSRSLDERRRRRLAGESTVTTEYTPVAITAPPEPHLESEATAHQQRFDNQSDFPLARLISARKWKLFASLILFIGTTAGLAVFGQSTTVLHGMYGDTVSRVFKLPDGTFYPHYCAFMLLAAAQLAFSIGWVRSRNPRDFGGYYRIWRWAASMLFVAAVCVATGLHHGLAELVAYYFPRSDPHHYVLNWLVPISVVSFPIIVKVLHDMSNCRLSTALFSLTILAAIAAAIAPMIEQLNVTEVTLAIVQISVCCAFMSSLLIHTWFVLHVSSEPPSQSSGLRTKSNKSKNASPAIEDEFDLLTDPVDTTASGASIPRSAGLGFAADDATKEDAPDEFPIEPTPGSQIETEPTAPANTRHNDNATGRTLRLDTPHATGETGRRGKKSRPKSKRKKRTKRGSA